MVTEHASPESEFLMHGRVFSPHIVPHHKLLLVLLDPVVLPLEQVGHASDVVQRGESSLRDGVFCLNYAAPVII